jgi:putative transposase
LLFNYNTPKYIIRDLDAKYGKLFTAGINQFGITPILASYRSPWQNGYVERVIGSIRRECLDHLIIINEDHLKNILCDYISLFG